MPVHSAPVRLTAPSFGDAVTVALIVPALALAVGTAFASGFMIVSAGKLLLMWFVLWGAFVEALLIIPVPQAGCYRLFVLIPFAEWMAKQIPGAGCTSAEDWIILLHTVSVMVRVREWPLPKAFNYALLFYVIFAIFQAFNPNE